MGLSEPVGILKVGPLNSGCYFSFLNQWKGQQHLVGLILLLDCFIWLYSVWELGDVMFLFLDSPFGKT